MPKKQTMQSGIRRFLIAAVLISLVLYALKGTTVQKDASGNPYIEKISATHELSLGELITNFKAGQYTKLHVINDSLLE